MVGERYKLMKDNWQGKSGDIFIMSEDDSSVNPFFKREDGKSVAIGDEDYDEVAIHLEYLNKVEEK